jgi:hypothetical protein
MLSYQIDTTLGEVRTLKAMRNRKLVWQAGEFYISGWCCEFQADIKGRQQQTRGYCVSEQKAHCRGQNQISSLWVLVCMIIIRTRDPIYLVRSQKWVINIPSRKSASQEIKRRRTPKALISPLSLSH